MLSKFCENPGRTPNAGEWHGPSRASCSPVPGVHAPAGPQPAFDVPCGPSDDEELVKSSTGSLFGGAASPAQQLLQKVS